ncbi:hypothetical protein L207DRAFT_518238 [Hyaloscypha variabilis F]|uniref:Uncharacterized protein n=1 Tax=Hyaloscypha variabilis (strain UAMH 11265 / GT02V1 / F) TaxID=1149755 RepID=A0A2J6R4P5_HYAVF|nr:hypothetical protein L207DRAFT_518238 [Hyaloscypha variabilis F]
MSPSVWQRLTGRTPKPKAVAAPTEEEQAKDKEAVQKAISEAVSAALTGDDFTKAVAGHLATQLQPSLKAALDISTVETKLLDSNADLSKRIDESNTKLSDLSTTLDTNDTTTSGKISAIEAAVAHITESLVELGYTVKALQETVASPDTTLLTSHGEKLDTISTGLKTLQEEGPAPVSLALSSTATKLDTITAELAAIKATSESAAALKSELVSLKSELETAQGTGFSGIDTKIDNVLAAIEAQNSTLAEIKAADVGSEVLAGVKASNDSHTAHAAALAELKAANISPEILEGVKASNEAHATHTKTLSEIQATVSTPAPAAEPVDLSPISAKLDEHTAHLAELKSLASAPAPVPAPVDFSPLSAKLDEHAAQLTDIKSAVTAPAPVPAPVDLTPLSAKLDEHTAHLTEIKSAVSTPAPVPEPVDLSPLSSKLDEHTAHLTEIKSAVSTPAPVPEKVDLSTLETSVKEIHTTLEAQTTTLSEIKDKPTDNTAELKLLSTLEALQTASEKGDNDILTSVQEVKALIEKDEKDQSAEILVEVREVKALVSKIEIGGVNGAAGEEVGENDKGVEVKKVEGNGVKVEEAEVVPEA